MESTGYPDGKEPKTPICPVCGEECETIYQSYVGLILGCDNCIKPVNACERLLDND